MEASNLTGTDERDAEHKIELTFHRAVLAPRTDKGAKQWAEDESRHGPVKEAIKQVCMQDCTAPQHCARARLLGLSAAYACLRQGTHKVLAVW